MKNKYHTVRTVPNSDQNNRRNRGIIDTLTTHIDDRLCFDLLCVFKSNVRQVSQVKYHDFSNCW